MAVNYIKPYEYSFNETSMDAWGRPKSYTDKSLLHGVFSHNILNTKFNIIENGITNPLPNNAKLVLTAGDYLYISMEADGNSKPTWGTIEWGEEV